MPDELKEVPANPVMLGLSKLLGKGKAGLNYPGKVFGIGLGDLVVGEAPEALEDWAHGFKLPVTGRSAQTLAVRPDLRTLDVALAPAGITGLAKGVGFLGRKAVGMLPGQARLAERVRELETTSRRGGRL